MITSSETNPELLCLKIALIENLAVQHYLYRRGTNDEEINETIRRIQEQIRNLKIQ